MIIEQKAREIIANDLGFLDPTGSYWLKDVEDAARLGIIEGVKMAHERIALIYGTESHAAKSIRALIEEQKL